MIAQKRVDRVFLVWTIYPLEAYSLLEPYLTESAQPCVPVFSALKTGKKETKKQKVSLEPHQAEKGLLVWFQWA